MPIYLDHASTTPLRPEALEAMLPFLGPTFGNPSSGHAWGRAARTALDEARERLAAALGGTAREVVLTSGGTEANNLALKGAAWVGRARGSRIVTSPVEHHAVGHSLAHLATFGFEVVEVGVDRTGRVDPDEVAAAVDERTIVLALMLANNEVGSVQPVREVIERLPRRRGVHVHVDAVAAAPYLDLDVAALGADTVAIGAHKFEGPKGMGALWIRRGTPLLVQAHGGSQERHRRAGTENVAGAVGMAAAYELACADKPATRERLEGFRARLAAACGAVDGVEISGHPSERLPGLLSLLCRGAGGTAMTVALDLLGIAASAGSACATGDAEPSHVLLAMGYAPDEAAGALRLSLGRTTTAAEVDEAALVVPRVIRSSRAGAAAPGGAAIAAGRPG
ncbi:MAG: cysteine desulfurase [Chloroflexi bacterium]|jgi:cysteine desulfurase|nr:cysteine desulfurase [Chloroflexota bacterium]